MIQVQIEVESGASRLRVSARASSVGRALKLVGESHPGARARVVSSAEPVQPPVVEVCNETAWSPAR